jgi:hypothetical protein
VKVVPGPLTTAKVELIHRFAPARPNDPRRERVWATTVLVRERAGWRVAIPETLGPSYALNGDVDLPPAELRRSLRGYRKEARAARAKARERRRATRTIRTGSTACPGTTRRKTDPKRDVTLAAGGDIARRQDAGVDLVGASQSRVGRRVCFELRFRGPVPSELGLELGLAQRAPIRGHPLLGASVKIEIQGDTAVASRSADLGGPYFPARVAISPGRDAIRVETAGEDGWPMIDPRRRARFGVEAWTMAPAIDNAYLDELEP